MSSEEKENSQDTEQASEAGAVTTDGQHGMIHCMTIIGQIEGHTTSPSQTKTTKYEHMIPQLAAIEESREIEGLLIMLNTVGGDVEAGLAIAELIASMEKPTVSIVLGGGHSIGVPLAVAAKHSFIVPSATMMVHPVRYNGLVIGAPQTYDYFERMQERIVRFVCANSKISDDTFRGYMLNTGELSNDVGSVLSGEKAVECGLIDELGGLSQALKWLNNGIKEYREANGAQKDMKDAE